ncbi:Hypothetical predicted protein, partial [Scomber scombrus]
DVYCLSKLQYSTIRLSASKLGGFELVVSSVFDVSSLAGARTCGFGRGFVGTL